jgi:hypothetical protein
MFLLIVMTRSREHYALEQLTGTCACRVGVARKRVRIAAKAASQDPFLLTVVALMSLLILNLLLFFQEPEQKRITK